MRYNRKVNLTCCTDIIHVFTYIVIII